MLDSLWLSVWFGVFLVLAAYVTKHTSFDFLRRSKGPQINSTIALCLILLSVAVFGGIAYAAMYGNNLVSIQALYVGLYGAGLAISVLLVSHTSKLWQSVVLALAVSLIVMIVVWLLHQRTLEAITMLLALLWVGPAVTTLLRFPIKTQSVLLVIFALIDIYHIWVATTPVILSSDAGLRFNGIIEIGHYSLGIGDFFVGAWAIAVLAKHRKWVVVLTAAVMISFARWFLRLGPWLDDVVLPYTMIIAAVTLISLWWPKARLMLTQQN